MSQPQTNPDCLFCKIVAKNLPADIVYEDDWILAFRDIYPKAETHVLCVPKKHFGTIMGITPAESEIFSRLMQGVQKVAETLVLDGFKIVINNGESAGQIVPHVHIHVLSGRKIKAV